MNVLIVDDDMNCRELARMALLKFGGGQYEIEVAVDGQQAIALCKIAAPDVVLLDLSMPVMDGVAVAKWLREQEIPYIPMTAMSGSDAANEALVLGAAQWLAKPVPVAQYHYALQTFIGCMNQRVIRAAAGMLARDKGVSLDEARALLRSKSMALNVAKVVVAQQVLDAHGCLLMT